MVCNKRQLAASALLLSSASLSVNAFVPSSASTSLGPISTGCTSNYPVSRPASLVQLEASKGNTLENGRKALTGIIAAAFLSASLAFGGPAFAENELSDKYGGGFDSSLVDQTCLVDKCSLQAKACLADDPSCRKGLTCTAKCLGDNSCITGCMGRYGNKNLDNMLKCTIEDNECIKIAILPGGADKYGEEPRAPAPVLANFNPKTLEGSWYKVVGYNPNYDCYACQRNTFSAVDSDNIFSPSNKLQVDVEFSMPHLLPDGSPPPPKNMRETIAINEQDGEMLGSLSIGLNAYSTHETMVFDRTPSNFISKKGENYARTAHSEGEMFGLKFWENWYVIGENDPGEPEFKFVYYNGKTRQNTYEGAFIYSRTRELDPVSMKKVYRIAKEAGMNPDNFCSIRNGCFKDEDEAAARMRGADNPFRGFLASTKVSELLGVEPVAARDTLRGATATAEILNPEKPAAEKRAWYYELGDYFENPHRHFQTMRDLRVDMQWPEEVRNQD